MRVAKKYIYARESAVSQENTCEIGTLLPNVHGVDSSVLLWRVRVPFVYI